MKKERYIQIKDFLKGLIVGTEWEGHVFTVGGCVRDEIMGLEIKDIDMCVSLQGGGIRFAEWLRDNGHMTKGVIKMNKEEIKNLLYALHHSTYCNEQQIKTVRIAVAFTARQSSSRKM